MYALIGLALLLAGYTVLDLDRLPMGRALIGLIIYGVGSYLFSVGLDPLFRSF